MEPTTPASDIVLGIPRRARAIIYLAATVLAAGLTPVAIAADGTLQAVLQGVIGACATAVSALAATATRR